MSRPGSPVEAGTVPRGRAPRWLARMGPRRCHFLALRPSSFGLAAPEETAKEPFGPLGTLCGRTRFAACPLPHAAVDSRFPTAADRPLPADLGGATRIIGRGCSSSSCRASGGTGAAFSNLSCDSSRPISDLRRAMTTSGARRPLGVRGRSGMRSGACFCAATGCRVDYDASYRAVGPFGAALGP